MSTLYNKQNGEIMNVEDKYYLNIEIDESKLEYVKKKNILKTEYQRIYRIKKSLLNSSFGTMEVRHIEKIFFHSIIQMIIKNYIVLLRL